MTEDFAQSASRLAGFSAVVLGWAPDTFWRATPTELAAVVGAIAGDAPKPVGRADIQALMRRFPDG